MTQQQTTPRRLAALALSAALAFTACGGSSDDPDDRDAEAQEREDERDARDDEEDEPDPTAAPVDTAAVEPTTTLAPATTVAPATTAAPETTVAPVAEAGLAEFCAATEAFFLPGRALDFSDVDDPSVVEVVFRLLNATAQPAIDLAPTASDAELATEAKRLLDIATPGLEAAGYDVNAGAAIPDNVAVGQALIDYGGVLAAMQVFLGDRCESDLNDLDAQAQTMATGIADGTVTAPSGLLAIESDDGSITASVPAEWTDVVGVPDGELRQLVAAPDVEAFEAGFSEPGMFILAADATSPDDWVDVYGGTVTGATESGCSLVEEVPYDDGVYTGTEASLSCGSDSTTVRIIGGTDEEGAVFFLLGMVFEVGREDIRDSIVQSFFI